MLELTAIKCDWWIFNECKDFVLFHSGQNISFLPLSDWLTNKFSRFVGPLVDEGLEGLLHRIDESLISCEAALCHVVHLVFEVQQVLHHVLVFFWSTYYLSSKGLRPEKVWTRCMHKFQGPGPVWRLNCVYLYIILPELQQSRKSSFHLAEELVEKGQLSQTILIQQGAQAWHKHETHILCIKTTFYNWLFMSTSKNVFLQIDVLVPRV